ncbi:MAG: hypothetical protein GX589_10850 [Deltaproteobacteria bacterium]|nr:hypothetical protein [Deltaproteobacteria bacterium]
MAETKKPRRLTDTEVNVPISLAADLLEFHSSEFEAALEQSLVVNAELIASELMRGLEASGLIGAANESASSAQAGEWIPVKSFSNLRALVGGRFENLKKKWVEAGLPLREKVGKSGDRRVEPEAWSILAAWILKQGYEARLADAKSGYFFEIRKLSA